MEENHPLLVSQTQEEYPKKLTSQKEREIQFITASQNCKEDQGQIASHIKPENHNKLANQNIYKPIHPIHIMGEGFIVIGYKNGTVNVKREQDSSTFAEVNALIAALESEKLNQIRILEIMKKRKK